MKYTRWALLKHPDRLSDEQRLTLALVRRHNARLWRGYEIREMVRAVYSSGPGEALPGRTRQHRGDRRLQPLMRVAGDELDTRKTARHQAAQERRPGGAVLTGEDVQTQQLALALGVHARGDDHPDRHDSPGLAHPHRERIQPEVPVRPRVEGALAESAHALVERAGHLGDGGLADAFDAEPADEVVYAARADALDARLGDDRDESALGAPSRLEQPVREVRAGPQLGDAQVDRAGAGVPASGAVSVALGGPLGAALAVRRAGIAEASALMSVSAKVRTISRSRSGSPSSITLRRNASGSIVAFATVSSSSAVLGSSAEDGTVVLYSLRLTPVSLYTTSADPAPDRLGPREGSG